MSAPDRRLREAISAELGCAPDDLLDGTPVGGGCIHAARRIRLRDGRTIFVKGGRTSDPAMFTTEAAGLRGLREVGVLRIPEVLGVGDDPPHLVLEWIESGRRPADFERRFGRALAEHHRSSAERHATRAHAGLFGLDHDNWLGATPQPNGWLDDWCEFWRQRRLLPQLELARDRGLVDGRLCRLGDRLVARLDAFLAEPAEPPCLLHGDLWSGNYLIDEQGDPALLDPAVYWGRREAELGMTTLFGSLGQSFYDAYHESWPLEPGWQERVAIYRLHHLLNHLNLFGGGYHGSCVELLERLVG